MILVLEPWAEQYELRAGQAVQIIDSGKATSGDFEIDIGAETITVFGWTGSILRVLFEGKVLPQLDQGNMRI